MELSLDLKRAICALFEVHEDERGVQRIVTPLEYAGSHDKVVLRARPVGDQWRVDENGEAALYARMNGGDVESDSVQRWAAQLEQASRIDFDEDETLTAKVLDTRLLALHSFASRQLPSSFTHWPQPTKSVKPATSKSKWRKS